MADLDPDLLRSPYEEAASSHIPAPLVAGLVVAGIAVVAVATWLLVRSGSGASEDAGAPGGPTTTVPGSTVLELVAFSPDPPILTHPTVLPRAWDVCSATDDRFEPDRFCADGLDQWVEVRYVVARSSDPGEAIPAGIHEGGWVSETDPMEVRFPINDHVALALRSQGIEADQVLEVADSIPVLADRASLYGAYELPIDWEAIAEEDLVGLLDQFEADATVDLARFEVTARTSNATLYGFNSRGYWTPAAATDLPRARLVEADRPVVVGESMQLRKGYAVWDQAGFSWRLEGNFDADGAEELALSVIAKLSDLPSDMSR
jgi:hypothetical protein